MKERDPYLVHKHVPYVVKDLRAEVRRHLPAGPRSPISAEAASQFVEETRQVPNDRLAALSILRTHASNGAEVTLSVIALLVATLAVLASSNSSIPYFGLGVSVLLLILIVTIVAMASAAHLRKLTATVWLRAYEDALNN